MSDRPYIKRTPVLNSTTGQSMAGNLISLPTILQNISVPSYGVSWSGTSPVGTISVEASNDYGINPDGSPNSSQPGTWNVMPFDLNGTTVTSIPVSGNTGSGMIDIRVTGVYSIRLVYTSASGTGTLNAFLNAKVT